MAVTLESRLLKYRQGDVLTPLLDKFFRDPPQHQQSRTMDAIKELATDKPRDRTRSFSASSLGSCMRAQTFRYLDYPSVSVPDPRLQAIFMNGKWLHLKWQAILLEMGVADVDHLEVGVQHPDFPVRGTIDAICELNNQTWIVDFKGVNPQSFSKYKQGEINQTYAWQLQMYMAATKIPRALLLYENKATGEYFEQRFDRDKHAYIQALARATALTKFMELKRLPPQLSDFPKNPACRDCPFQLDCKDAVWSDQYIVDDEAEIPL